MSTHQGRTLCHVKHHQFIYPSLTCYRRKAIPSDTVGVLKDEEVRCRGFDRVDEFNIFEYIELYGCKAMCSMFKARSRHLYIVTYTTQPYTASHHLSCSRILCTSQQGRTGAPRDTSKQIVRSLTMLLENVYIVNL